MPEAEEQGLLPEFTGSESRHLEEDVETRLESADASVYELFVFFPLVHGKRGTGWAPTFAGYRSVGLMLVANIVLQFCIAYKIWQVIGNTLNEERDDLLGLCQTIDVEDMPWFPNGTFPSGRSYVDCDSLAINVMNGDAGWLDVDGNGEWTVSEAQFRQEEQETKLGRILAMTYLHKHLLKMQRDELDSNSSTVQVSWLRSKSTDLHMCSLIDADLCQNMEARSILRLQYPDLDKDDRIDKCRDLMGDFCEKLFGRRFDFYTSHRANLCGDSNYEWNEQLRINTLRYDSTEKWTDEGDGIVSPTFKSFLFLILMVWGMIMLGEFHALTRLLEVLTCMKADAPAAEPIVKCLEDGTHQINALPTFHRAMIFIFVWIPRATVFVLISYIGTKFLGTSNDYIDLLLNATALGFLIEIDSILEKACADESTRTTVASCAPLVAKPHNFCFTAFVGFKQRFLTPISMVFLLMVMGAYVWVLYNGPHGKLAMSGTFNCLCQVRGQECLASRLLSMTPTS